jgi:AcrR family transcriptional regulator
MSRMESADRPSRAQRTAQTRQRILDTALRLFATRSYAAASLQDIADELGVAKAAVYYHYRTKQDILVAIMEPGFRTMDESMAALAAMPRSRRRAVFIEEFATVVVRERRHLFLSIRDPAVGAVPGVGDRVRAGAERMVELLFGPRATLEQRLAIKMTVALPSVIPDFADIPEAQLRQAVVAILHRILDEAC